MEQKLVLTSVPAGLCFTVEAAGARYKVTVPEELLEDEVGTDTSPEQRKAWVEANIERIMQAFRAKTEGGICSAPFARLIVQEEF